MKLRAFHLRALIDLKKKRKKEMIKEYAHLIWLINKSGQKGFGEYAKVKT